MRKIGIMCILKQKKSLKHDKFDVLNNQYNRLDYNHSKKLEKKKHPKIRPKLAENAQKMGKIIKKSELCAFRNKKILKNDNFNVLNNNGNRLNYNQ